LASVGGGGGIRTRVLLVLPYKGLHV